MWKIDPKIKTYTKTKHDHTSSGIEHVCNSGTTLQNSGKRERKRE
jgi:hypothetical protein